jgi:hypothetical protein
LSAASQCGTIFPPIICSTYSAIRQACLLVSVPVGFSDDVPADKTGYLIGSIEGRVAVQHVEDSVGQNKNFPLMMCIMPSMSVGLA